ncbi:hypothetical protein PsYK624_172410 [Phanerochaete sordida]|uniref:Uncharacterized protein n=1 Tax=Phanerochaete sordida TaxID=48140 RepID=A0A9P3GTS5_9APHY|nr:hypothetical protein PsYK624_172410 [Phanerochaete sordida]
MAAAQTTAQPPANVGAGVHGPQERSMRCLLALEEVQYDWIPFCHMWAPEHEGSYSRKMQRAELAVYHSAKYEAWKANSGGAGVRRAIIKFSPRNLAEDAAYVDVVYCRFVGVDVVTTVVIDTDRVMVPSA